MIIISSLFIICILCRKVWALRFFINDSREDWVNLIKKITSDMQFFYRIGSPIESNRLLLFSRYVEKINEAAILLDDEHIKVLVSKMNSAYQEVK